MSSVNDISSKVVCSDKEKNCSLTSEEEDILQSLLKKKDVQFLIEKKDFYKEQILNLYDMERDIQKFQEKFQKEVSEIQKMLFCKCEHEWVRCSDGGYDEGPDYICCICESSYGY